MKNNLLGAGAMERCSGALEEAADGARQQERHYQLLSALQGLVKELPSSFQQRLSYTTLSDLALRCSTAPCSRSSRGCWRSSTSPRRACTTSACGCRTPSCSVTFARDPQRRSHPLPGEILALAVAVGRPRRWQLCSSR